MKFEDEEDDHINCQCGHGLVGFEGVRYQKGFGLLGRLFKWALPYVKQFGSYLGKNLLSFGSNVANDVVQGKSIKESAKTRFTETKDKVVDDTMAKLNKLVQGGSGRRRRRVRKINKRPVCKPVKLRKSRSRRRKKPTKKRNTRRPNFAFLQ